MNSLLSLWSEVLGKTKETISKPSFDTWLKSTELLKINEDEQVAYVRAENEFSRDWLDSRYKNTLETILSTILQKDYQIIFWEPPSPNTTPDSLLYQFNLKINPNKTFQNFNETKLNRLALAATRNVAESPIGKAFNPLTIYGLSPSGKSHLLCAIANRMHEIDGDLTIVYLNADQFRQLYLESIRTNQTSVMKQALQHIDVFLLDDIDFFEGNVFTQTELNHVIRLLYSEGKQIVLTAFKEPKDLILSDQLQSIISWGLVVEIEAEPEVDYIEETKIPSHLDDISESPDEEILLEKLLKEQEKTNELLEEIVNILKE